MERIRHYNPDMRLLLSFRDPVERAFSQWCMERERRADTPEFAEAIRAVAPHDVGHGPRRRPASLTARSSAAATTAEQLAHVLELFPAGQVLALDYHRTFKDPEPVAGPDHRPDRY